MLAGRGGRGEGGVLRSGRERGWGLPEEQVASASSGRHMNDLKAKALYLTVAHSTRPAPLLVLCLCNQGMGVRAFESYICPYGHKHIEISAEKKKISLQ